MERKVMCVGCPMSFMHECWACCCLLHAWWESHVGCSDLPQSITFNLQQPVAISLPHTSLFFHPVFNYNPQQAPLGTRVMLAWLTTGYYGLLYRLREVSCISLWEAPASLFWRIPPLFVLFASSTSAHLGSLKHYTGVISSISMGSTLSHWAIKRKDT